MCRYPQATLQYNEVKRSLFRHRTRALPPNAKNVATISTAYSDDNTMKKFGETESGKRFFKTAFACEQFEYCIFSSDDVVAMINDRIPVDSRNYLMDATFKICPYGTFNQILIIYVTYLDAVIFY